MAKSVVIIGAGVGGLSAAIYARLRGFDVVVLEAAKHVGGKAASLSQSGYRLDPGPSIIILIRIYEALFADAGRRMSDYLTFQRLDPISRVLFQGEPPLDLPAGRAECLEALSSYAPQDAVALRDLMSRLDKITGHIDKSVFAHPIDRPWQLIDPNLIATALPFDVRLTYKQLVDQRFKSPLLRAFFYGFPSYGGQTFDSKAPGALMIPYLMIQEGVYYPVGGVGSIPTSLERLAKELGVEIRTSSQVVAMNSEKGQVKSVTLSDGQTIESHRFISNVDRITTRKWLGHQVDWRPSLSYFTIHWGIKKRLPGLSHHTLLVPKDYEEGFNHLYREKQFPTHPIVYLNDTTATDESVAPPNTTNLFAVVTCPAEEKHIDWVSEVPEFKRRVREQMSNFGIDFDPSEVEFERIQTPSYFAEAHGNYLGSLYGPEEKHRMFGGLFPLSNRDEEYKNLFYCGGSVQPGAGLPMVTLSGKFAAKYL